MAGAAGPRTAEAAPSLRDVTEAIVSQTSLGVWAVDADDRTAFANARMAEILGSTPDEMLGARLKAVGQRLAGIMRGGDTVGRLALDDFGTGYSALGYLKRFPFDIVKVDRSFVRGLGEDSEDSAIVGAVLGMARALGMEVVAEGIETEAQLACLTELGVEYGQGFYFARPGPLEGQRRPGANAQG